MHELLSVNKKKMYPKYAISENINGEQNRQFWISALTFKTFIYSIIKNIDKFHTNLTF